MILLQKNQLRRFVLTLSELAIPTLPNNWMIIFRLEQNDAYEYKHTLTDLSQFPESYNLFEVTEGVDITFDIEGDYSYFCYQMPDDSEDETEGHLVESGKMRLLSEDEELPTFVVNTDAKIFKVNEQEPTS
jgi:hypothetical protein